MINFVLLHLGPTEPPYYLKDCITQLRITNPVSDGINIYFVAERQYLPSMLQQFFDKQDVQLIDSHAFDPFRTRFSKPSIQTFKAHLHTINANPLWVYSSLRFKYLQALVYTETLQNVFTIEMNNLIYVHARHHAKVFSLCILALHLPEMHFNVA